MPLLQSDGVNADPTPENQDAYVIRTGGKALRRSAFILLAISLFMGFVAFQFVRDEPGIFKAMMGGALLTPLSALYILFFRAEAGWRFADGGIDYRARTPLSGKITRIEAGEIAEVILRKHLFSGKHGYSLGFRLKSGEKKMVDARYTREHMQQVVRQVTKRLPGVLCPDVG